MNKDKILTIIITLIVLVCALVLYLHLTKNKNNQKLDEKQEEINDIILGKADFNANLIKLAHKNSNYLISPYSIEIALDMLMEGSDGNTLIQIANTLSRNGVKKINSNKLRVANATFIKDEYKNNVKSPFINNLKNKYDAEIIYSDMTSPKIINDWVNKKTDGMIKGILNDISKDFVLGIINAVTLDTKWLSKFECEYTRSEEFTKINGKKIDVEMMHKEYASAAFSYLLDNDYKGIIIPYEEEENSKLEFVGIIPDDIDKFIKELSSEKLKEIINKKIIATNDKRISLSLPRFKYEYEEQDFIKLLKNLGIIDVFDKDMANLSKIMEIKENLYVDEAIHKTFIDLNESGTKAAAVTYFGINKATAIMPNYEKIDIKFDRPFVYMIRDAKTEEILFFGAVYEPNKWEGSTCNN